MTDWQIPEVDLDSDEWDGLLFMEPRAEFDQCVIGKVRRFNDTFVLYSKRCVLETLGRSMEDEVSDTEVLEFFEFNVIGAWMGEATPAFLEDDE